MPPLLADFIHNRVCKPICEKLLTLPNYGLILNDGLYKLGLNTKNMNILVIALIILLIAGYINEKKIDFRKWLVQQNIMMENFYENF